MKRIGRKGSNTLTGITFDQEKCKKGRYEMPIEGYGMGGKEIGRYCGFIRQFWLLKGMKWPERGVETANIGPPGKMRPNRWGRMASSAARQA